MSLSIKIFVLSLSYIVTCGANENADYSIMSQVRTLRLPNETKPLSYDLEIFTNVHRNEFNFSGSVTIRIVALNFTDKIVLHAKNLMITQISLTDLTNEVIFEGVESQYNSESTFLTVFSNIKPLQLKPGNEYLLKIVYNSTLAIKTKGFYRTSYSDSENGEIWIATTQFQPTYARRAFPCYDEPQLKANFSIKVTHGRNYSALSNMPPIGSPVESGDDTTTTEFFVTPPMSTYNIAFVVSNLKCISTEKDNITHRIFFPPERQGAEFALETAVATLHALQEYFNISYPLAKIDHVGVSQSYGQAMENWGLIIYREDVLLSSFSGFYPLNAQTRVITHELAHQWFGNLVTLKWWTYTWLNEGLATYYGNKAIQLIHPEVSIRDHILATELGTSWDDIAEQQITHYVEKESEISLSFNGATYHKACRILEMFEHAFTESTFKNGIFLYLTKYQYSSADEDDLFEALQEAATADSIPYLKEPDTVRNILKKWTLQKYYPVITVKRHYENGTFSLHQAPSKDDCPNLLWDIPITLMTKGNSAPDNTTPDFFFPAVSAMHVDPTTLSHELLSDDWLILNKKAIGFYRVNYDERNWKLITAALKENPKSIHAHNRAHLIRDVGFLLLHNKLKAPAAFEFYSYLEHEDDYLPWNEAVFALRSIYYELEDTASCELFKKYIGDIIHKKFKLLEYIFNGPRQSQRLLSTNKNPVDDVASVRLFEFSCMVGLKDCLEYSKSKFKDVIRENMTMNVDKQIEKIIFCEGLKTATEDEFQIVFNQLSSTVDKSERMMLIECLTASQNIALINLLLDSTLNSNVTYNPEERSYLIENISRNSIALPVLIQFLKANHNALANITSNLWISIAFLRYELRTEDEKQAYIELLDEVKYLGTLTINMEEQVLVKDYPEFHNDQEEIILDWLRNHYEVSGSRERVVDFKRTEVAQ